MAAEVLVVLCKSAAADARQEDVGTVVRDINPAVRYKRLTAEIFRLRRVANSNFAAGIAVGYRSQCGAGQAAHTDKVAVAALCEAAAVSVGTVDCNFRNGGASGQVAVADAHQAAHIGLAQALLVFAVVNDVVAGDGAVHNGLVLQFTISIILIIVVIGHADQTADGVCAQGIAAIGSGTGDLGIVLRVHDDVLHLRACGDAEQSHGVRSGLDIHILNLVAVAVVGAAEPGVKNSVIAAVGGRGARGANGCKAGDHAGAQLDIVGLIPGPVEQAVSVGCSSGLLTCSCHGCMAQIGKGTVVDFCHQLLVVSRTVAVNRHLAVECYAVADLGVSFGGTALGRNLLVCPVSLNLQGILPVF